MLGVCLAGVATAHSLRLTSSASPWIPTTAGGALAELEGRFQQHRGVRKEDEGTLRAAALRAPLASAPYAYEGFEAKKTGNAAPALALFLEARKRDPRSRIIRYSLSELFALKGDIASSAAELATLVQLEPQLLTPVAKTLAGFFKKPSDVDALAPVLSRHPDLYQQVAQEAARSNMDPALLIAFYSGDRALGRKGLPSYASEMLQSLVRQGQYDQALKLWRSAKGSQDAGEYIRNERLVEDRPLPPFDWDLMAKGNGNAQWRAGGGISLDYFGRGSDVLARQLLLLPMGRYLLAVDQATDDTNSGGLAWEVRCADSNQLLVDKPVLSNSQGDAGFRTGLIVPPGCRAQWLSVAGRRDLQSGDGQRAEVTRVSIERQGNGRAG